MGSTASLKRELDYLLKQPLIASGVRAKYITSGTRAIVDGLIEGTGELLRSIRSPLS